MKLDGRRTSSNVDDRRGKSSGKMSFGIGGTIVIGLIIWLLGGNPMDFISQQMMDGGLAIENYTPTEENDAMASFAKKILAGTEDVWTEIFEKNRMTYKPPRMVLFSRATSSGCGSASSSTGPFYCSADQTVYIDLSFFEQMKMQLNADGDFAYAYVIAHEVGHHVQYLLGTLDEVHKQQRSMSEKESNQLNVRMELQADFYAGIWAHYDDKNFGSLEDGDLEEGLNAASQIGDDRLQMKSKGYTVPDAFNHGTSSQRTRWLKKGYQTGDVSAGNTFNLPYGQL